MSKISWQTLLDCTQSGARSNLPNVAEVLRRDPLWRPDRIWYDEFLDRFLIANSPIRELTDRDVARCALGMHSKEIGMRSVSSSLVREALNSIAVERTRHCVKDYFESLKWDGVERIAHAFEDVWGADTNPQQPSDHVRAASSNFFIGMVARILDPGCQVDNMVVFEGNQGLRKSSALKILGGDWYCVVHESVQKKDFFLNLSGVMLIEISEIDKFSPNEVAHIKGVLTTRTDRYRSPYGHYSNNHPRQSIFAGTTNRDDWATDETGNRRFWPIICGDIDLSLLQTSRGQLIAEAIQKYRNGVSWWEMPESSVVVQSNRMQQDIWTQPIAKWLTRSDVSIDEVTPDEVAVGALQKSLEKQDEKDRKRICAILRKLRWTKHHTRRHGTQMWVWQPPNDNTLVV